MSKSNPIRSLPVITGVVFFLMLNNSFAGTTNPSPKPACNWLDEVKVTNTWFERDQAPQYVMGKLWTAAKQAGTAVDEEALKAARENMSSVNQVLVAELDDLVNRCGWPTTSGYGDKAPQYAAIVVQHAPLEVQLRYLPLMQAAEQAGEIKSRHVAMLEDRIRMYQNRPQIYGSQITVDSKTQKMMLYAVEDPANLDERRSRVGMVPASICAYLSSFTPQVEYEACK